MMACGGNLLIWW